MVNYVFEEGQRVAVMFTVTSGYISGYISIRVPGDGTGSGWYYVRTDDGQELGPYAADQLRAA